MKPDLDPTVVALQHPTQHEYHLPDPRHLSPLELGIIDYFVHLFRIFSLPKSIGEIYGLLFASPTPLNMDHIIRRLKMSKGAVSQGLRLLRSYGALKVTYLAGDRRDHYTVELGLRKLATGFLKEQLEPHMADAAARLLHLQQLQKSDSDHTARKSNHNGETQTVIQDRISSLDSWQRKGRRLIPLVLRILGT